MTDWLEDLRNSDFAKELRARVAELEDAPAERSGAGWQGAVYGFCPVQGHGTVDGLSWYFRARHDEWRFEVWREPFGPYGHLPAGDPIWKVETDYDGDASWMPISVAWALIEQCIAMGREQAWTMLGGAP